MHTTNIKRKRHFFIIYDFILNTVPRECSVERSGVLTMFNGQGSTVSVPCKYRLADIQCGDYQLRVTPGSQLDSYNTFSPYSVFVKMQKTDLAGYVWVQTTSRRLQRVSYLAFLLCDGAILTAVSHPHS